MLTIVFNQQNISYGRLWTPIRDSRLLWGIIRLWRQSIANQLRTIYAEEKDQENVPWQNTGRLRILYLLYHPYLGKWFLGGSYSLKKGRLSPCQFPEHKMATTKKNHLGYSQGDGRLRISISFIVNCHPFWTRLVVGYVWRTSLWQGKRRTSTDENVLFLKRFTGILVTKKRLGEKSCSEVQMGKWGITYCTYIHPELTKSIFCEMHEVEGKMAEKHLVHICAMMHNPKVRSRKRNRFKYLLNKSWRIL